MGVGSEIWAISRGVTIKINLLNEPAFYEGFKTIVNSGERNFGEFLSNPQKNIIGSGVVSFFQESHRRRKVFVFVDLSPFFLSEKERSCVFENGRIIETQLPLISN